ncbi:hypothetical protein [Lysinibacillus parviboronicapiens]|uniref:hypothetical protein n=1 Tax=Lysinibacillus parviboronicapiens TaxID=436516 RepID=UPI0019120867|nr:hypothetical protein [Lysinibacillus parviboronicapiens]
MPIAHKGMLQAAKAMACTAITSMDNPAFIEEAKKEWQEHLEGRSMFHSFLRMLLLQSFNKGLLIFE